MKSGENNKNIIPNILVISHNCFSKSQSNGRTLESLFLKWNSNNISQMFFYDSIPDSEVCKNYYRITDLDLLKSRLLLKDKLGDFLNINDKKNKNVVYQNNPAINVLKKLIYFLKRKTFYFFIFCRDFLWKTKRWDNKNFNFWIKENKPDIILLYPGEYSFIYKIALSISNKYNIPIVIYNSENHYLKKKQTLNVFYKLYKKTYNRSVEAVYNKAKYAIYSNDMLKFDFDKIFNLPSTCILTTSSFVLSTDESSKLNLKISYAGNLGHERWKSLLTIAKAAKKIDNKLVIEVYSGYIPKEANKYFTIENGIDFKGAVSYNKVREVINASDIVIHTEGFSDFTKWDIRHGFSTKIADLLSSGKCFLMYGPKEIACVDYLVTNQAAWVAHSEAELNEVLNKIVVSKIEREKYLENAKRLVEERHNLDKNCKIFEDLIVKVYQNQQKKN